MPATQRGKYIYIYFHRRAAARIIWILPKRPYGFVCVAGTVARVAPLIMQIVGPPPVIRRADHCRHMPALSFHLTRQRRILIAAYAATGLARLVSALARDRGRKSSRDLNPPTLPALQMKDAIPRRSSRPFILQPVPALETLSRSKRS